MSGSREGEHLFSTYRLRDVLESYLASVDDTVLTIDAHRFDTESDEHLAALVASEFAVAPLELSDADISVSCVDAKVDVSQDPNRAIRDRSRPFYRDGIEVTYSVPVRGTQRLLRCQPGTHTLDPPWAIIGEGELRFLYRLPDRDVAATKQIFLADLAKTKEWLPWTNHEVTAYNSALEAQVRERVRRRRAQLAQTKQDLATLGFRVRATTHAEVQVSPPARTATRRAPRDTGSERTYDVALSFAGEDREFVQQVAEELRQLGVSVFYDRFELVNLWGKDLAEHLGKVYSVESRFVVIFASRAYASKAWPNHEKQFALGRHLRGDQGRILPVRFDDTEIPGIPTTLGYLDLRVLTPRKLAALIRQKLDASVGER